MHYLETCDECVGKPLVVVPYYGHGWSREDPDAPPAGPLDHLGPEPFQMVLQDFIHLNGKRVGGIGRIVERDHPLAGLWVSFCLRMKGEFNFTERPGHCLIWISGNKPVISAREEQPVYSWVLASGSPRLVGYGIVAESLDWVRAIYARAMDSRKLYEATD